MRDTVQAEVTMTFLVSQDLSFRIPVELSYDSSDPYAVEITFHLPGDAPVSWAFARELLLDGLSRPTGEGDVRIAPASPRGSRTSSSDSKSAVNGPCSGPGPPLWWPSSIGRTGWCLSARSRQPAIRSAISTPNSTASWPRTGTRAEGRIRG
ncbi:hypothetical protein GCM10017744_053400 [Streptomyces antimycoticus]